MRCNLQQLRDHVALREESLAAMPADVVEGIYRLVDEDPPVDEPQFQRMQMLERERLERQRYP
jgi:hypothetical protein